VVTRAPELARSTRLRLWSEHLELPIADIEGDPVTVFEDKWKSTAKRQLELRESGRPTTKRLVELPNVSRRSKRLVGPVQSLFVDA
jgi:hypothetical protein